MKERRHFIKSQLSLAAGALLIPGARSTPAQMKHANEFPWITLFSINQAFAGWAKADKDHFVDGASFDLIYTRK